MAGLVLAVLVLNVTGCTGNKVENADNIAVEQNIEAVPAQDLPVNLQTSSEDKIEIVASNSDKMVPLQVADTGRANPFLPYGEGHLASTAGRLNFDLPEPPAEIQPDSDAGKVVSTKVSGIMYDKYNSSAIVNIENSDYLVRPGDVINGYKVLSITKNYVAVQLGDNIYKAGVGELFSPQDINFNTIPNLSRKFAGSKYNAKK